MAHSPGVAFFVNFVPALKYLPEWLPGMGWKSLIREWRERKEHITSAPYIWTKEQMVGLKLTSSLDCVLTLKSALDKRAGKAVPSIVQKILSTFPDHKPSPDVDLDIELLASTIFGG